MTWITRKSISQLVLHFGRQRSTVIIASSSSSCQRNRLFSSSVETPKEAETSEFYDIVIAGGGLIGTACGVALGNNPVFSDKRILLLEASKGFSTWPPPPNKDDDKSPPNYSNRVFALSPGSKKFLETNNVWQNIWRYQEVSALQVWDALSDASITIGNEGFAEPVSYIVENPILLHALSTALKQVPNITTEFGCSLQNCTIPNATSSDDGASIILSNGKKISTSLVIGADGYNSRVRAAMKSPYLKGNYERIAIVATLRLMEGSENNIAWQRFLPTGGPIALLPISREYSSLVWSTTPENAKRLMELTDEDFAYEVNTAIWKEYPRSNLVQKSHELVTNLIKPKPTMLPPSISGVIEKSRATFPLGIGHAAYYVNRNSALIGDAAHRVHPLGGQGLNLGFGDVSCLVKVLENSARVGGNIGDLENLKVYETERQRHNVIITSGLDFLHRLYSFDFSPVVAARSIGLTFVNSSDYIKKCIIAQAAA